MEKKLVRNRDKKYIEKPPFPHNMLVELTNICNHQCIFCAHKKMHRRKGYCQKERMTRIIKEAYELGTREIGFYLTGEPFLCKDLNYYIKLCSDLGFEYIYITTNGVLANVENVKSAIEFGLSSIKFSINAATRETYKIIHGRDDFDKVVNNIKQIYKMRNDQYKEFPIFASFVIVRTNQKEVKKFKEDFGHYFDDVNIVEAINQGGNMPELNDGLLVNENKSIQMPCEMLFNRLHITYEGYLNACCVDFDNMMAVENLNEMSLEKAWYSERMIDLRKQHLSGKIDRNMCYRCINNIKTEQKGDILPLNEKLL